MNQSVHINPSQVAKLNVMNPQLSTQAALKLKKDQARLVNIHKQADRKKLNKVRLANMSAKAQSTWTMTE